MKLRIKGDAIRLRLGRSEVERLVAGGTIVESTTFDPAGHQRLEYRLAADVGTTDVVASFAEGRVTILIPSERVATWGRSAEIGIAASQPIVDGRSLRILIEKDLECLDASAEEPQDDAYRRPDGLVCGPVDRVATEALDSSRGDVHIP